MGMYRATVPPNLITLPQYNHHVHAHDMHPLSHFFFFMLYGYISGKTDCHTTKEDKKLQKRVFGRPNIENLLSMSNIATMEMGISCIRVIKSFSFIPIPHQVIRS